MSSVEVRACASADEMISALAPMLVYFGFSPDNEFSERIPKLLEPDRVVAAYAGDQVVGGAAAYRFDLTIPGARIPVAGLTFVAVLPTHRRQGVLRAMMRAQLDACHARGEAVAYLWASEDTIYRRFGFGMASVSGSVDVAQKRALASLVTPAADVELIPPASAESIIAPIFDEAARQAPGMTSRNSSWWQQRILPDLPWQRRGNGQLQCAVARLDGVASAYALYRLNAKFESGVNNGTLAVMEAIGTSPTATRAIWQYLFGIDWLPRLQASLLPLDHPLLLFAAEPRRLNFTLRDGVWVRLVDVAAALSARSYAAADPIVVELTDAFCPWNAGRWRIGPDGTARTREEPDLSCDVTALGSTFLGGFSWMRLAAAGQVEELRAGGLAKADALFHTSVAPWCPEVF